MKEKYAFIVFECTNPIPFPKPKIRNDMKAKAKTAKSQHSETYLNQNQQFLMTKVSTGMNMA